MKRIIALTLVLVAMVACFAGCGKKESDTIKIAVCGPLTGDYADFGKAIVNGAQVAVDNWNEKGGVMGKKIELVQYDDKNNAQEAGNIAERIVSDKDVVAVVGHFSSGVAMTVAKTYQEAGIALVNGSAAHTDFSDTGDCIFRLNATYDIIASSAMQIINGEGYKKFGILQPNTDAGISNTECIHNLLEKYGDKMGAEIAAEELFEDGTVDFSATINKFNEAGVEVVYVNAPYAAAAPLIKQYAVINPDVKFVSSSIIFGTEFIDLTGDLSEGVCLHSSFYGGSTREPVVDFMEKYMAIAKIEPNTFAAQIFDGTNMILTAIEHGESAKREDIVKNLYEVTFPGVTCEEVAFMENGDCALAQTCLEVVDGKWVEVPGMIIAPPAYIEYLESL